MPSDWQWWPWFCLRSAGLPADWLKQADAYQQEHFQEALIWQNRQAWQRIGGWLSRHPQQHNSRARQHRRTCANYLQRYTMKNDSIGFFGPLGWGQLETGSQLWARPLGEELCNLRQLFWEPWALQELQRHWSNRPEIRPYLSWQRDPTSWVEGQRLYRPGGRPAWLALEPEQVRAWQECRADVALPEGALRQPGLPLDDQSPRWLQAWLDGLPEQVRPQAEWDRLQSAFGQLEQARGPQAVDAALHLLEQTYEEIAGRPATRHAGNAYAGRTLVYLTCRRNLAVGLGRDLLGRYGRPLDLVVRACRWFCYQIHHRLRQQLLSQVRRLRARYGGPLRWSLVYPQLVLIWEKVAFYQPVAEELQARMAACLAGDSWSLFDCPHGGWSESECHGIDLLWAHSQGQWQAVVGDVHPGIHTLGSLECFQTHPFPEALIEPGPARLRPVPLEEFVRCSLDGWGRPEDIHVFQENRGASWRSPEHQIGSAELFLDDEMCLSWPGAGGRKFDCLQLCEHQVQMRAVHFFRPFQAGPRVELDGLMLARQRWQCSPHPPQDAPRQFFLRSPLGEKPVYIDRDHPDLEPLFLHLQRRYEEFEIEEVWPLPSSFWVKDAQGRSYSSEIRLTAQFQA